MLTSLLFATAFAAGTSPAPLLEETTDPAGGVLLDIVEPGLECSTGVVLTPPDGEGNVQVRELHAGRVGDDEVRVTEGAARVIPGERVIVYRDEHGVAVVGAS
jgi:hypothetical protein